MISPRNVALPPWYIVGYPTIHYSAICYVMYLGPFGLENLVIIQN